MMNSELILCVKEVAKNKRCEHIVESVLHNITQDPTDVKFRRLNMDSAPIRNQIVNEPHAWKLFDLLKFAVEADGTHLLLNEADLNLELISEVVIHLKKEREAIEDEETNQDPMHWQATMKALRHKHRKAEHQDESRKEILSKIQSSREEVRREHAHESEKHVHDVPSKAEVPHVKKDEHAVKSLPAQHHFAPGEIHENDLSSTLKVMRNKHRKAADQDRERQEILQKIRDSRRDT